MDFRFRFAYKANKETHISLSIFSVSVVGTRGTEGDKEVG